MPHKWVRQQLRAWASNPCCWLHCVVLDSLIKLSEAFLLIHEISIFFSLCILCYVCLQWQERRKRERDMIINFIIPMVINLKEANKCPHPSAQYSSLVW